MQQRGEFANDIEKLKEENTQLKNQIDSIIEDNN